MSKYHRHDPRNKKKNKHKNLSKSGQKDKRIKRVQESSFGEWEDIRDTLTRYNYEECNI